MAGFQKKTKLVEPSSFNITFNCDLNPNSRGVIVNEIIKYCLYEREQIPLPFKKLKQDINRNENGLQDLEDDHKNIRQIHLMKKVEERKSQNTLSALDQLFDNLSRLFERYPEIHQVMILLGGTVISPKETYLVNLPPVCPDADPPADKSYVNYLSRQLIMQDMLGDVKSISPTNMTVLVHAPRDCGIEWFLPKPAFKTPQRSRQFEFNIICNQTSSSSHNLTPDNDEFDISGIRPLDPIDISASELENSSVFDTDSVIENESLDDVKSLCERSKYTSSCIYSSKHYVGPHRHSSSKSSQNKRVVQHMKQKSNDSGFDADSSEPDMIWFQSPVVVKGYKNKLHHKD